MAHPRDAFHLDRSEGPDTAFTDALDRGRLHHAWLLTGPQGVGKASFAYRAARRLLGARPVGDPSALTQSPSDPVSRMVSAQSHPDLLVLGRAVEGQPARKSIPVDEARRLPEFFSKAPALAPYRVAIIDAADDLNVNAANAVLKTLEEPSGRGVLFLVSHAPGRLLTTIRSRCRRLGFTPWPIGELEAFGRARLDLDVADIGRLAAMARGAPGRLLALAESSALQLDEVAVTLLVSGGEADHGGALRLAESFRGAEGAQAFAAVMERLSEWLRAAALRTAGRPAGPVWSDLWRKSSGLAGQVEALNLDRADAFWSLLAEIAPVVRRFGAAPC